MSTPDDLRLAATSDEMRASLWSYAFEPRDEDLDRSLASQTTYWVFDPSSRQFGPSKFVGYADMTIERYVQAREGRAVGDPFDGSAARAAVEKASSELYRPDPDLSDALAKWIGERVGLAALTGIDRTKWQFVRLPPLRRPFRDDNAVPIRSDFTLEYEDGPVVVIESAGGTSGTEEQRNPDYAQGLELLLSRFKDIGAKVASVRLESGPAVEKHSPSERRIPLADLAYPVAIADPAALARVIRRAASGHLSSAGKGGNPNRRLAIAALLGVPTPLPEFLTAIEGPVVASTPVAWIFQSTPVRYDLPRALRTLRRLRFLVNQQRKKIRVGDRVYLWHCGNDAAIHAMATVIAGPEEMEDDRESVPFRVDPTDFSEAHLRAELRIDRVFDPPLRRTAIKADPDLAGLSILHQAAGTNFPVSRAEDAALQRLLGLRPGDTPLMDTRRPIAVADIKSKADSRGLLLPEGLFATLAAALNAGKHIILTGAPGTAKTTLAFAMAEAAQAAGQCSGFVPTTATADWTTFETIGGLRPTGPNTLEFEAGSFLQSIKDDAWLLIDELNRSNFDRAFGQLFTVLSGQAVTLPYKDPGSRKPISIVPPDTAAPPNTHEIRVPRDWRVIATMNVFDKSLLFKMSYALMRRFMFIEVPTPEPAVYERLIARASGESTQATKLAQSLLRLRAMKDLGPALYMDAARFISQRMELGSVESTDVVFEAFTGFLLPQFEGIDDREAEELYEILRPLVGAHAPRLKRMLEDALGIKIRHVEKPASDDGASA